MRPATTSSPQLNDPGLEFTSRPQRIGHFPALLNRVGTPKTKVRD